IKEAVLDIRPMTVIIGPNNTGKTYLSYVIYGMYLTAQSGVSLREAVRRVHRGIGDNDIRSLVDRLSTFFQDSTGSIFANVNMSVELDMYEVNDQDRAHFPRPFLLPAERNALIITYKLLANRRYKLMKDLQRELFATPPHSSRAERQVEI